MLFHSQVGSGCVSCVYTYVLLLMCDVSGIVDDVRLGCIMLCGLVGRYQCFGETCFVHVRFQALNIMLCSSSELTCLKMEKLCFSETLVCTYMSTQHYNPEDQQRHLHCNENLKYHILGVRYCAVSVDVNCAILESAHQASVIVINIRQII
jgi:hypothetical protein